MQCDTCSQSCSAHRERSRVMGRAQERLHMRETLNMSLRTAGSEDVRAERDLFSVSLASGKHINPTQGDAARYRSGRRGNVSQRL